MCITLPHYYWLHLKISCPFQFLQLVVDVEACPGIGGGIQFLRFGQGFGFPVGKALAFRNLFPEEDGIYLCRLLSWMPKARTYSCNSMHACCSKGARLCKDHEVIPQGKAYFRYTWVFQQCDNRQSQSRQVEAEQKAMFL